MEKKKIIFLDIDGVLNCCTTKERHRGFIGIDEKKIKIFKRILEETNAKVVLSSTWRLIDENLNHVKDKVCDILDITPYIAYEPNIPRRGTEIDRWYQEHKNEIEEYVILDDDPDILEHQLENWWQTFWEDGLTEAQADLIIRFLNYGKPKKQK
ncbi:MAG: HAD domain-containing protein [Candidatus Paceibacterota bacterium]